MTLEGDLKREALLRELRKEARKRGIEFETMMNRGKGGHCLVRAGDRQTTLKSGELTPTYVRLVRKQLGLD